MRIRQVKPAFWTDGRIAKIPAPIRLFYIGLWMVADDSGWFRWDAAQLGAELYSFEPLRRREKNVALWGDVLEGEGRIKRYPCGHAYIPTMTDHQRMSAATKRVKTFEKEHDKCIAAEVSGRQRASADPRPERNVSPTETELSSNRSVKGIGSARARELRPMKSSPAVMEMAQHMKNKPTND